MTDLEKLLAEVTPGEWKARKKTEQEDYIYGFDWYHYSDQYGVVGYWTGHKDNHKEERWCLTEADARLIAMAPALARKVIAAEKLADALRITRDRLSDACHSEFDGVWTAEDFERETSEADEALAAWEALK